MLPLKDFTDVFSFTEAPSKTTKPSVVTFPVAFAELVVNERTSSSIVAEVDSICANGSKTLYPRALISILTLSINSSITALLISRRPSQTLSFSICKR